MIMSVSHHALVQCSTAWPNPSCLQATSAVWSENISPHTVIHTPWRNISNRPAECMMVTCCFDVLCILMEIDEGKKKSSIVGENWSQGHSLASAINATTTELWQLSYDTPVVTVFYTYYMWLISDRGSYQGHSLPLHSTEAAWCCKTLIRTSPSPIYPKSCNHCLQDPVWEETGQMMIPEVYLLIGDHMTGTKCP